MLEGVTKINKEDLIVMDDLRDKYPEKFNESGAMDYKWFESEIRPHNFIYLRKDKNSISFTLQNGPIKEVGVNGCQIEDMIETCRLILLGFNKEYNCKENEQAMLCLTDALMHLTKRKLDREERGVEGHNKL